MFDEPVDFRRAHFVALESCRHSGEYVERADSPTQNGGKCDDPRDDSRPPAFGDSGCVPNRSTHQTAGDDRHDVDQNLDAGETNERCQHNPSESANQCGQNPAQWPGVQITDFAGPQLRLARRFLFLLLAPRRRHSCGIAIRIGPVGIIAVFIVGKEVIPIVIAEIIRVEIVVLAIVNCIIHPRIVDDLLRLRFFLSLRRRRSVRGIRTFFANAL